MAHLRVGAADHSVKPAGVTFGMDEEPIVRGVDGLLNGLDQRAAAAQER
jgi:hypothetical protein